MGVSGEEVACQQIRIVNASVLTKLCVLVSHCGDSFSEKCFTLYVCRHLWKEVKLCRPGLTEHAIDVSAFTSARLCAVTQSK